MYRRRTSIALVAACALAAPSAAQAGPLVADAPDCSAQSSSAVFAPWLDPAQYVPAPGGDAESAAGWTLSGGAAIAAGNEPWFVHGASDSHDLSLPAGASATTATMCVGIEHPTVRFFSRGSGASSSLHVDVRFETADGSVLTMPVGVVGPGSWAPSPVFPLAVSLLPLLPGDHTPVQFRFTAVGGGFDVDDVHVDPWGRR